ncbi:MAG: P1 family peptidase [Alphaproteobacteria bacterium]
MTVQTGQRNLLTDVDGISVGNAEDHAVRTGVTVILPDEAAIAGVDTRGGGPGTRETDALDPACLVDAVDAVVLSGGSVYGLAAADGVVNYLGAQGRGYRLGAAEMACPVVPGAILFDLMNGGDKGWGVDPPYRALGTAACQAAGKDFTLGNAGAGMGAIAGQVKGGLGSASIATGDGIQIAALIAVNPFGSVMMPGTNSFWSWPYEVDGEFGGVRPDTSLSAHGWPADTKAGPDFDAGMSAMQAAATNPAANTTIGVVATNAALTPGEAKRLAIMAQDGLSRAIRPVHTPVDGDTLFSLATGRVELADPRPFQLARLGTLAADCVARAVARGVYEAESIGDIPAYRTLPS